MYVFNLRITIVNGPIRNHAQARQVRKGVEWALAYNHILIEFLIKLFTYKKY
jgi:hypothetical protein